jgi:hypothetical protein
VIGRNKQRNREDNEDRRNKEHEKGTYKRNGEKASKVYVLEGIKRNNSMKEVWQWKINMI